MVFVLSSCYSVSKIQMANLQSIPRDERLLIAVVDFENGTGEENNKELVEGIYGKMLNELNQTGRFRLLERKRLESVLKELKLHVTGLVDPENAKQVGQMLGVSAMLFGELSVVKYERNKQSIFIMWTEGEKTEVSIDARLVDVESGEILATSRASTYVKQRNWVAFWFARLGRKMNRESVIETGIELACKKIAGEISESVYK